MAFLDWHVLRLLDEEKEVFHADVSRYLTDEVFYFMCQAGILTESEEKAGTNSFRFTIAFHTRLKSFLVKHFVRAGEKNACERMVSRLPTVFMYKGTAYVPKPGD